MTLRYTIRTLALDDLEKIWLYSFHEWGSEQADNYLNSLFSRFGWLADTPLIGKKRDDIKTGYYCFPEGMHLIFYTILNNKIDIIGIPHQSADIVNHVD